ncbi:hypothetical protein EXIGLDRAFT_832801 [Exidia glandulosa HHB12029]|uniref:DUF6533 domain-containing protein n=1 Tax=Exidia glandulosa HHB12029 TaxID=1314781 RepID=A0A165L964_EXIGL|nr:hypothetical protein EXIGLDRAFT_832801 [Exidia glandulosa HHB12029]
MIPPSQNDLTSLFYVMGLSHGQDVALYTLAVYDWLLCLADEVSLNVLSKPSVASFAYMLSRYWPLVTYPVILWVHVVNMDRNACNRLGKVQLLLQVGNTDAEPIGPDCYPRDDGNQHYLMASQTQTRFESLKELLTQGYFLAPLLFDGSVLLFTAIHIIRHSPAGLWWRTIVLVFFRDGAVYLALILLLHLFNAIIIVYCNQTVLASSGIGMSASLLLPSVVACRMVLNLRRTARAPMVTDELATTRQSLQPGPSVITVNIPMFRDPSRSAVADQ